MKKLLMVFLSFLLCLSLVSATTITLAPSADVGNEYIFNDPSGYNNAHVTVTFNSVMNNFQAHISATGLKPGFTYQVKLLGTPACAGGSDAVNEEIGYSGRWYCPLCSGDSNAKNRNDAQYQSCKSNPSCSECIYGYLIFGYFTADGNGAIEANVITDHSYHVLRCDSGDVDLYSVDTTQSPFKDNTLKCSDPELCHSYDVIGETQHSFSELPEGTYSDVKIALTEESFHQTCGTWATVLAQSTEFTINKLDDGNGNFLLDNIDVGDPTSESGHLDMTTDGWSYIGDNNHDGNGWLGHGGYGGYDGGSANFRGLMGPPTGCSPSDTSATFTLDAGDSEAKTLTVRHLDGSVGDSFDVCIVVTPTEDNCFAHYAADGTASEDWKTTVFTLPEGLSGEIKFKLKATDPAEGWCAAGWGQVMINWIHLYGNNQSNVPEFSTVTALIALLGAVTGIIVLRKRRN